MDQFPSNLMQANEKVKCGTIQIPPKECMQIVHNGFKHTVKRTANRLQR